MAKFLIPIMKISSYLILSMMLLGTSYAALNENENFENYTAKLVGSSTTFNTTNFLSEAIGKWSCFSSSSTPDCILGIGSPASVGATAGYTVFQQGVGGNKFMRLWASNGDVSNYYKTQLLWNYSGTPMSNISGNIIYTKQYNMKLVLNDFGKISGSGQIDAFAGLYPQLLFVSGDLDYVAEQMGGRVTLFPTDFTMLRMYHDKSLNEMKPLGSTCDMSDLNWHFITYRFNFNGSCYLSYVEEFIDGTLCSNETFDFAKSCGTPLVSSNYEHVRAWKTFAFDIDNLTWYNASMNATPSTPFVPLVSCNDGIDNDGDGFIDYPADPECLSANGTLESPYHYTQCNDGIDNDGDGFVDQSDQCCNGTKTLNSETCSWKITTIQSDTPCNAVEFCLLNEKFPYSDNITHHAWTGSIASFTPLSLLGSLRLYFNNNGVNDFSLSKNITNTNTYNTVQVWFDLSMATKSTWSGSDSSIFYIELKDAHNKTINYLKFNLTQIDPLATRCIISFTNGTNEAVLATVFPSLSSSGIVRFELIIDQVTKQYQINYQAGGQWFNGADYYEWYNPLALKVNSFVIRDAYDSTKFDTYIDNINILGADTNFDTVCDVPELPYYLQESFNGYLAVCDWSASYNIFFYGTQNIPSSLGYYSAQKDFKSPVDQSPLGDAVTRFFTMSFDLTLVNVTNNGNWEIRLYDNTGYNFFVIYSYSDNVLYSDSGTGVFAAQSTSQETMTYKIVFDFQTDKYDVWVNSTKIASQAHFINNFYNLNNVDTVKIASKSTGFTLDNLAIFTSDQDGNPQLGSTTIAPKAINSSMWCGLLYTAKPVSCNVNADCVTGMCMPYHQCSSFDWTYCDKHSLTRGNYCMATAYASCGFSGFADIIFSNFLWVLVAMLLLMGWVYISIMARRRK